MGEEIRLCKMKSPGKKMRHEKPRLRMKVAKNEEIKLQKTKTNPKDKALMEEELTESDG